MFLEPRPPRRSRRQPPPREPLERIEALTEELAKTPDADLLIRRGELFRHPQEWMKADAEFVAAARHGLLTSFRNPPEVLALANGIAEPLSACSSDGRAGVPVDELMETAESIAAEAWDAAWSQ